MSNPGVLTLTKIDISPLRAFRVEDNLGESIHFHYNDIRIDLTIKELLHIAEKCDEAIYDLVKVDGFDLDSFDDSFLMKYAKYFVDLVKIEELEIPLKQLNLITYNKMSIPMVRNIGKLESNYINEGQEEASQIIVFNDELTIVWGQTLALQKYKEDKNSIVKAIKLTFNKLIKYGIGGWL